MQFPDQLPPQIGKAKRRHTGKAENLYMPINAASGGLSIGSIVGSTPTAPANQRRSGDHVLQINAIKVYCPICMREGRKKWIDTVGHDAKGTGFPHCKLHGNVRINFDQLKSDKVNIIVSA